MKKLLIALLASVMLLLAACGDSNKEEPNQDTPETLITIKDVQYPLNTESLTLRNKEITDADLADIVKLKNLKHLDLRMNDIVNISALSALTKLETLDLGGNEIADLKPLAILTSLTVLDLRINNIANLSGLEKLINLTELNLSTNDIQDASLLFGLPYLETLYLNGNLFEEGSQGSIRNAMPDCKIYF
ncbi:MAG: leucine-rich repeat domain-containing protein [Oscillospiraceae bacterium]|nr:leucine-rich repeat domain-containing protein [Oscillospiraceae bacterium]